MRALLLLSACVLPTSAEITTPISGAYATFQAEHGDIDMCNPSKVRILLEALGLDKAEAKLFEDNEVNGAMLRVAASDGSPRPHLATICS